MSKNKEIKQDAVYPYGFGLWMNALWQIFRKNGSFKDSGPGDEKALLDYDSLLTYFMNGDSPKKAYANDLKEG